MSENPYIWRGLGREEQSRVTDKYKQAFELACERAGFSAEELNTILKQVGLE